MEINVFNVKSMEINVFNVKSMEMLKVKHKLRTTDSVSNYWQLHPIKRQKIAVEVSGSVSISMDLLTK